VKNKNQIKALASQGRPILFTFWCISVVSITTQWALKLSTLRIKNCEKTEM
jgi:hypothetical protein